MTNRKPLTVDRLANLAGVTARHLQKLIKAGTLPAPHRGVFPDPEKALSDLFAYFRNRRQDTSLAEEKLLKTRAERLARERENEVAAGELIPLKHWLDCIDEHVGALRQGVKTLLLTEQPATLSGRSEADIREMNAKTYAALCRRMQNAAGKLDPSQRAAVSEAVSRT